MPTSAAAAAQDKRWCYFIGRCCASYFCFGNFLGKDKQSGTITLAMPIVVS
jgi:hypothetical protein